MTSKHKNYSRHAYMHETSIGRIFKGPNYCDAFGTFGKLEKIDRKMIKNENGRTLRGTVCSQKVKIGLETESRLVLGLMLVCQD